MYFMYDGTRLSSLKNIQSFYYFQLIVLFENLNFVWQEDILLIWLLV